MNNEFCVITGTQSFVLIVQVIQKFLNSTYRICLLLWLHKPLQLAGVSIKEPVIPHILCRFPRDLHQNSGHVFGLAIDKELPQLRVFESRLTWIEPRSLLILINQPVFPRGSLAWIIEMRMVRNWVPPSLSIRCHL